MDGEGPDSSQENFTAAFKAWFGPNPGELRTMDYFDLDWSPA